jgi:predicted dehydrogenase
MPSVFVGAFGSALTAVGVWNFASSSRWSPEVDASMRVELAYPGGVTGHCRWDMDAPEWTMTWSVTGTEGVVTSPAFAVPHMDNRLRVSRHGRTSEEVLGDRTSYTYQLARLADSLQGGAALPNRNRRVGGQRGADRRVLPPGSTVPRAS